MNYDMSQYICLDDANNNNDDAKNDKNAENNVPRESSNIFPVSPIEFDHLTSLFSFFPTMKKTMQLIIELLRHYVRSCDETIPEALPKI